MSEWPWVLSGWRWIGVMAVCIVLAYWLRHLFHDIGNRAIAGDSKAGGLLRMKADIQEGVAEKVGTRMMFIGNMLFWFTVVFFSVITIVFFELIFRRI